MTSDYVTLVRGYVDSVVTLRPLGVNVIDGNWSPAQWIHPSTVDVKVGSFLLVGAAALCIVGHRAASLVSTHLVVTPSLCGDNQKGL